MRLKEAFNEWLHIEDDSLLYTIAATKLSHKLDGDPIWLMIIGASSGGKSEYLRAFTQENEIKIDDLTQNTFVSGYKSKDTEHIPHFAESLSNRIWYIYDLSILMSKNSEERSRILSDMRMIYDGHILKKFGNKITADVQIPNNTHICGTTPVIDNTMLEDQMLGTRFITYRIPKSNRHAMMDIIDRNHDRVDLMRESLKLAVKEYESTIDMVEYELDGLDNQNLQLLSNMTTLLRTAVSYDKQGEPSNLAYPEEPGRLYKQMKKLYTAYRMIGLTEDEALRCIRKICVDNINPIRITLLKHMMNNTLKDEYAGKTSFSTTKLHSCTGIGKKAVKMHMGALRMLGLVDYSVEEDQYGRVTRDNWRLLDSNLILLVGRGKSQQYGKTLYPLYRKKTLAE